MVMDFQQGIIELENLGLTDVLLPFLLVFAISYAILENVGMFSKKNINVIISLVMGLLVVIPHVTGNFNTYDPVEIINQALPSISLFVIAIVMFFILAGAFGAEPGLASTGRNLVAIFAILVVGYIFGQAAGWWGDHLPSWLDFLNDSSTQALLVVVLVFGLIITYITGGSKGGSGGSGTGSKVWDALGDLLGKGESTNRNSGTNE